MALDNVIKKDGFNPFVKEIKTSKSEEIKYKIKDLLSRPVQYLNDKFGSIVKKIIFPYL